MKFNKRYFFTLFTVFAIVLVGVGATFAYYSAVVVGNSEEYDLTIQAGDLKISYLNGTLIDEDNIIPGWSKNKYFTIKNESTVRDEIFYKIYLNVNENNFFTKYSEVNDTQELSGNSNMTYSLLKCESEQNGCNSVIVNRTIVNIQEGNILVATRGIVKDGIDYYALKMEFPNLVDINQSQYGTDGNTLSFAAYVIINQ